MVSWVWPMLNFQDLRHPLSLIIYLLNIRLKIIFSLCTWVIRKIVMILNWFWVVLIITMLLLLSSSILSFFKPGSLLLPILFLLVILILNSTPWLLTVVLVLFSVFPKLSILLLIYSLKRLTAVPLTDILPSQLIFQVITTFLNLVIT